MTAVTDGEPGRRGPRDPGAGRAPSAPPSGPAAGPAGGPAAGAAGGTGLGFDRAVPPGGYAWWYVDAISDDGAEALTLIAFVGSVFSPYYAWAGRRDALDHSAVNVALYRRGGGGRWALTERGRGDLHRAADSLRIGPSALWLDGDALTIEVDERAFPIPRGVRGRVRVSPEVRGGSDVQLEAQGDHRWWPIAPRARVEVAFDEPALRWSGTGYLDCNWGAEPLEQAFHAWTWSRAPLSSGASVLYDLWPRRGEKQAMALRFDASGAMHPFEPPPLVSLPSSLFGLPRQTRSDGEATVVRTLTDAHFYARSMVRSRLCGQSVTGVHESLSLDRFDTRWAKLMIPFRMPRRPGRGSR